MAVDNTILVRRGSGTPSHTDFTEYELAYDYSGNKLYIRDGNDMVEIGGGLSSVNNSNWSGTDLAVANGGTGASSFTSNAILTGNGASAIQAEANLTFDSSTLALTGDQTISGVLKHSTNGDNRLTLDDDSDSSNVNQVTLAGANNVNILIDGTNNGTGDFQVRARPTTANDLDTASMILDMDKTTAVFNQDTSQQFQIGSVNRLKILETGTFIQNSSLGVGVTPIDSNARIQATSHIEAGVGSGAIGLTINDGGGNSNVTFNHTGKVPEQNGNSGRIEVNTDGVGGQYMAFELAGNVTSGVSVATTEIARINSTGLQSSLSGTAASPALRVNDSDTGLYKIADNKLGISTAGTFAVAVDASQNVGIGTQSPGAKLDVKSQINLTNPNGVSLVGLKATEFGYSGSWRVIQVGNTSGNESVSIGYDPSGNSSGSFTGDGREVIFRNGVEFMTPNSANNGFHNDILVLKDGVACFGHSTPWTSTKIDLGATGNSMRVGGHLYFYDSNRYIRRNGDDLDYYSNNGSHNFTSGNVGIGTASPSAKLDIVSQGNARTLELTANNDGTNGAYSVSMLMHGYEDRGNGIFMTDSGTAGMEWFTGLPYQHNGTAYQIGFDASGGQAEYKANAQLYIDGGNSRVGIGTSSPGYKLDVAGAGRFSGHLRLADGQAYIAGGGEDVQLFHSNTYGGFLFNQTNHFYFDQVAADKDWIFRVDDSDGGGDYREVMRIQGSTQNVGIGTNSPGYKLQVSGGDIAIDAGEKLYFDGGTHTYIKETSNDVLDIHVGTDSFPMLRLTEGSDDFVHTFDNVFLAVGTSQDLTFNHNGSNSYIQNATGTMFFRQRSSGTMVFDDNNGVEHLNIDMNSNVVINEGSNDIDFRVESNGKTHAIHVDAGADKVNVDAAFWSNYGHRIGGLSQQGGFGTGSNQYFTTNNILSFADNTNWNGAMVINTNITRSSARMCTITVKGYGYGNQAFIDFDVNFYTYSGVNGQDGVAGYPYSARINDRGNDKKKKFVGVNSAGKVAIAIGDYNDSNKYYYGFKVSLDNHLNGSGASAYQSWTVTQSTTDGFGWLHKEEPGRQIAAIAQQDTSYTKLLDPNGSVSMYLGGTADGNNYYQAGEHKFRNYSGSAYYARIGSGYIRGEGGGSVGTPQFSFQNDTNTGMYSLGADDLGFSAGGVLRYGILNGLNRFYANVVVGPNNNNSKPYIQYKDGYDTASTPSYSWYYDNGCGIGHPAGSVIAFSTGSAERGRFTNQGLLVRDGSAAGPSLSFTSDPDLGFYRNGANNMRFSAGNAIRGTWNGDGLVLNGGSLGVNVAIPTTDGVIRAGNDVIAYYSSDERLKENVKPIENAIDKVSKIRGVEFDWIVDKQIHDNEGHDVGVIAQEVEKVLPEVVQTRDNGYKAVKYEKIVSLLIEAVNEQQQQINELKEKLNG